MNKTIIYILLFPTLMACNRQNDVSRWTDCQIDAWLNQSEWSQLTVKLDTSINKRTFVEQNIWNPKSWKVALQFLKASDFKMMDLGRYELADDGTYANVEEYTTKDSSHFEAHRKYIDIQLLVFGKEYIYVSPMEPQLQTEVIPYDDARDIEFFDRLYYDKRLLEAGKNFIIFFPSDAHQPCMKVDSNERVRKVVVKVPVYEKGNS